MPTTTAADKFVADTEKMLRDSAYIAIGLGVLSVQRAQVQRQELTERFKAEADKFNTQAEDWRNRVTEQFGDLSKTFEGTVADARTQIDGLSKTAEGTVAGFRAQVTEIAKTVDAQLAPARAEFEARLDTVQDSLPSPAKEAVANVRSALAGPEALIREAWGLA